VGIATFGPAGVNKDTANYGRILEGSPKREWRGVDLITPIRQACGLGTAADDALVGFDTDVNAPALAEFRHRCYLREQRQQSSPNTASDKPITSLSYVTIGTGVGVGLIVNSQPIHGLLHPEGGHVSIQPLEGDTFKGYSWGTEKSPYGGVGTVEGTCSSVALTERLLGMQSEDGSSGGDSNQAQAREVLSTLADDHEVWNHASNAIANLCVSILLLTSCQKIVLGGGIMKRSILFDKIRHRVWVLLNGYLDSVEELCNESKLADVIVESSWKELGSGLVGAFALALDAHTSRKEIEVTKENDVKERNAYTSGVLAGIGLSFGCILLSTFVGRRRRN
jgi:fructokinase